MVICEDNKEFIYNKDLTDNNNDNDTILPLLKKHESDQTTETTYKILSPTSKTQRKNRKCCGVTVQLISGLISLVFATLLLKFSLLDLILENRLKFNYGSPSYEFWRIPQPEVTFSVNVFSIINADEFLNGTDNILKFEEIGPIVYRELVINKDIVYHSNSTVSYTAVRTLEFKEEANQPGILNRSITVIDLATVGMASFLNEGSFFTKMGFKLLMSNYRSQPFINTTIYQLFWNQKSELVAAAKTLAPFMVPTDNLGMLHFMYKNFEDRYNVRIGSKYSHENFFLINTVNDRPTVPGFQPENGDCFASLVNSTEGLYYPQKITKKTKIHYWRKSVCRPVPLVFEKEVHKGYLETYKFSLNTNFYDRLNSTNDCYKGTLFDLPSGVNDVSKCYMNLPFVSSSPHFLDRPGIWENKLGGIKPDAKLHRSYIFIEPTLGVPVEQCARMQSNIAVGPISGYSQDLQRLRNMILPIFWAEYNQRDLSSSLKLLLTFLINVLPILQIILIVLTTITGAGLISLILLKKCSSYYSRNNDKKSPKRNFFINTNPTTVIIDKTKIFSK